MLTTPDTAQGELGHWWPQILPDGDHVIFTAYRTPIERATIEVLSIRTGTRKVLVTGGVYGIYVPTGHLLYGAGEAIWAVPFDLDHLAVTGPARSGGRQRGHERHGRRRCVRRVGERDPGVPAGQLLHHRERPDAGGPAGPRDPGPSRQRSLQSPAPLSRRAPHRGGHPLGQLGGGRLGLPGRAARAGPASPRVAAGTSAPSGRPTGGS